MRILVAGIGNIFLGDDAFGCEVLRQLNLRRSQWPENVCMVDFGIRGFDLSYALLDGYDLTILVDAAPRGEAPGTIYVIEPDLAELDTLDGGAMVVQTHGMDPVKVLLMVKSMGGEFNKLLLVGCEPETFGPEEGSIGLSEPVAAAVPAAVELIESMVAKQLETGGKEWVTETVVVNT